MYKNPFNANTNLLAPVVELPPLDPVRLATLVDLWFWSMGEELHRVTLIIYTVHARVQSVLLAVLLHRHLAFQI